MLLFDRYSHSLQPRGHVAPGALAVVREKQEREVPRSQVLHKPVGVMTTLIDPQGPQINIISHEEAGGNIVREGYAEYERGGLQITDAGRAFLKKSGG